MGLVLVISLSSIFLIHSLLQLKSVNKFSIFALDRNAFGAFGIYCTLLASGIGAGHFMGAAEKAYACGWFYTIACMGFTFQLILTALLAPRIFQWRQCLSSGELLGKAFNGKDIRCIAGVMWMLFCMGIISAQVVAMGRVMGMLLPQFQLEGTLLLSLTVIFYSCLGGVRSVVSTDIIQALLLLFALCAVVVWGVEAVGGVSFFVQYNLEGLTVLHENGGVNKGLILLFVIFFLGDALIPISIQRVTMCRNVRQAKLALCTAAVAVALVALFSGALGSIAFLLDNQKTPQDTFAILISHMPASLNWVLLAGLLAAVMSSCDSYLNSSAVAFSNDVLAPLLDQLTDKKKLKYGRFVTLLIGIGGIIIASQMDDILDILVNSFALWMPTLLPPTLLAMFSRDNPRVFFYLPLAAGVIGMFLWKTLEIDSKLSAGAPLLGMMTSFLCMGVLFLWKKYMSLPGENSV